MERGGTLLYDFVITILKPEQDRGLFSDRKLSKTELKEVTEYLQQQTSRGIPVKFRVGIYNPTIEKKLISVSIDTKNLESIDLKQILVNRVSDPEILKYLLEETAEKARNTETKEISIETHPTEPKKEFPDFEVSEKPKPKNQPSIKMKKVLDKKIHVENEKNSNKVWILGLLAIALIVIGFVSQQVQIQTLKTKNQQLVQQTTDLKEAQTTHSKVDTFGRFFLTVYFSNPENQDNYQKQLTPYVATDTTNWQSLGVALKSVHSYGIKETKGNYQIQYLVILENADNTSELQQISFDVQNQADHFSISSQPSLTNFSF